MGLFKNDIYIFGLIIGIITLILIYLNNRRQKRSLAPDVKILHYLSGTSGLFNGLLGFHIRNMGSGWAKIKKITYESEIGDFELSGYEEDLFSKDFAVINLKWDSREKHPNLVVGHVKVEVSFESPVKKKNTRKIEYYIEEGKLTLLKDGN